MCICCVRSSQPVALNLCVSLFYALVSLFLLILSIFPISLYSHNKLKLWRCTHNIIYLKTWATFSIILLTRDYIQINSADCTACCSTELHLSPVLWCWMGFPSLTTAPLIHRFPAHAQCLVCSLYSSVWPQRYIVSLFNHGSREGIRKPIHTTSLQVWGGRKKYLKSRNVI